MSSFGVPVPAAFAGPSGASSSKPNPFAFPTYTPAETMQVQESEEGVIEEEPMDIEDEANEIDASAAQERSIPQSVKAQWKDFTQSVSPYNSSSTPITNPAVYSTLSKAVSLQLQLRVQEETREKQRKLQYSKAYQSGSMRDVHQRLEKLRAVTESTIVEKRKQLDGCLDRLARYPLEGLPAPSPDDGARESEFQLVRDYVSQINGWLDQIRPMVQQHQEAFRQAEERREREEEATRRASEERRRAEEEAEALARAQLDKAKWAPINSERVLMAEIRALAENLEEHVTDLEYGVEELRNGGPAVEAVVLQKLEARGYKPPVPPSVRAQSSIEDGEVVQERSPPPRSVEELKKDVVEFKERLEKATGSVDENMKELDARKKRVLAQKRDYHELARDNATLSLKVDEASTL